jgi:hypothetical protein
MVGTKTLLVADRWQLETLAFAHAQNQVFHSVMVSLSAIFLKIIGSRTHSDPKFSWKGGISYNDARKKVPENFPVCVLLRKNLRNSIPARPVTKIPLVSPQEK